MFFFQLFFLIMTLSTVYAPLTLNCFNSVPLDLDRYDLTMKTGHAPYGVRDLNPLHELLLRHHSNKAGGSRGDPLPSIQDQDVYKGKHKQYNDHN